MFIRLDKKAQSLAEYAIVFALIIGVFSAMNMYTKRALQSRLKSGTDFLASNNTAHQLTQFGATTQYEPYYLESDMTSQQQGQEQVVLSNTGVLTKQVPDLDDQRQRSTREVGGHQTYIAPNANQ